MNCPEEVADAVLTILREASLRIRMAGNADDAGFCAIEANHIHNLPSLIRNFSVNALQRYLHFARNGYVETMQRERPNLSYEVYLPLWERLGNYLAQNAL